MSYTFADLNEMFFRINTTSKEAPLFDLAATTNGFRQETFLTTFYPDYFLEQVGGKNRGVYFDRTQRSRIFNGSLAVKRQMSLRAEIIHSVTINEWLDVYDNCNNILTKCSEDKQIELSNYLDKILKKYHTLLPSSMPLDLLVTWPLNFKLTTVMLLMLLFTLDITPSEMSSSKILEFSKEIVEFVDAHSSISAYSSIEEYADGTYRFISFGHYPQHVVTDTNLIQILDTLSPDENDILHYNDQSFIKYRSELHDDYNNDSTDFVFSNGETIMNHTEYYFRIEPIRWRILGERTVNNDTHLLLVSERILDHKLFNPYISYVSTYICLHGYGLAYDWKYSDLRHFLNNKDLSKNFINMAFAEHEKEIICNTELDNSTSWKPSNNKTTDQVFVLSVDEARANLFRYTKEEFAMQAHRNNNGYIDLKPALDAVAFLTDYAICRGVKPCDLSSYLSYYECPTSDSVPKMTEESLIDLLKYQGRCIENEHLTSATYWLRSPGNKDARFRDLDREVDYTRRVTDIMEDGHLCERGSNVDGGIIDRKRRPEQCDGSRNGVRPAMFILKPN